MKKVYCCLTPPTPKEIEAFLRTRGADEPVWRAQACGGYLEVALDLDPVVTKEWHKTWCIALAGSCPEPENILTWTDKLTEKGEDEKSNPEATLVAIWDLLVQIACKAPMNKYWQRIGLRAIKERERARTWTGTTSSSSKRIQTATGIAHVYALAKTAGRKQQK